MRTRTTLAAVGLLLTLTACGGDTDDKPSAPPSLTEEQRASARAAAGLPPEPSTTARYRFLEALNDIDRRIVDGKDDKAVSRGLNQCRSIKNAAGDEDKQVALVQQTLGRFTIDTRLPDIATPETGGEILAAVHKNLCPDF
ncbi:hypothetical protein PV749_05320 [Streptomyces sp. ID03-2B]|uniref:hypothetical protein n=1 Tax=Streptomyces sp. ID03-2B TaxID=3028660 RepID=UPI0029A37867|nr:hypothetical protein [Streptomyces sp. ID03-2B]MDX3590537.1 hypothetical protein [Streptomyces sp. ID03-2B]